jgi:uncharacterized protein YndB with AHSA1/START domain
MVARERTETTRNRTTLELAGDRALVIKRRFNAPPRIVFDAWTRADLVKRWWAPASHGVVVAQCEADVRAGGRYRYVLRQAEGEIAFSGEYLEVSPPRRLVYTQVFEPMATSGVATITLTFAEVDGGTELVAHEEYPSAAVRAQVLASGMEHGMRETMDQLEELLLSLVAPARASAS